MNNTITKLEYEKINDVYSKAKYAGFDVIMNMETGYINATKLCSDGGKQMKNWLRNDCNKELIEYFDKINGGSNLSRHKYEVKNGTKCNNINGTYVHPKLIPHIASWVSPEFANKVSEIVNNFLIKEKEDEIRRSKVLLGEKDCKIDELKIMLEQANVERRESEKHAKQMLQNMIDQNDRTHTKLDKAEIDNHKIKTTLGRVEARVEKIVEEVVPPAKQLSLHEQFGIMKLNDKSGKYQYKVYCTQARGVGTAKHSILKSYPKAELFLEIKPNANAKNFLHKLKELY